MHFDVYVCQPSLRSQERGQDLLGKKAWSAAVYVHSKNVRVPPAFIPLSLLLGLHREKQKRKRRKEIISSSEKSVLFSTLLSTWPSTSRVKSANSRIQITRQRRRMKRRKKQKATKRRKDKMETRERGMNGEGTLQRKTKESIPLFPTFDTHRGNRPIYHIADLYICLQVSMCMHVWISLSIYLETEGETRRRTFPFGC